MSDNSPPTWKLGDGIGLVSGTHIDASQTPYTGQWMARWLQTKDCQLSTDTLTGNIVHQFEGRDCTAHDQVKSKEFEAFELVRVDMNQRYSLGSKCKSNSAAEDAPLSDSCRSGETSEVDREKLKIAESSSMIRNVKSINDETTISEKGGTQHLTESSIKWKNSGSYCYCHGLDISKLDFEHFSTLDINRKIETILASKKLSDFDAAVSVKMVKENLSLFRTIGTSSLLEFAPGNCLATKEIIGDAKNVMTTSNGFLPNNAEDIDGASSPVIHRCKYQKTNMVMFSSGLTCVDPMNNKLTCMRRSLCSCCSSSKSITTGIKSKTGSTSKGFGNLWTGLKGKSNHLASESPFSEVKGDSSCHQLLNQRKHSYPDGADMNLLPCEMPKCSKHDTNIPESWQNLKSEDIRERFPKFSSTTRYLLIADKVDKYHCLSERTMGDSAFTLENGSTSFETSVIPTKQDYDKKEKSVVTLENFACDVNMKCCHGIGVHLIGENNEFSTEDVAIYNHPFHRSNSLLGESLSRSQKGFIPSNPINSKPSSSSSPEVASRNPETRMADKREVEQHVSTDKAVDPSHKEACVSSTDSLAADHIVSLSHLKASNVSSSSPLPNHTSESFTRNSWIKRLQNNHSDSLSLSSKRFKKSEKQQSFSRVQNHNPLSHCSLGFTEEQGKCKSSMALSENVLPSGDSDESVQLWLRRWCRNGGENPQTTSRSSASLKLHPEKFSLLLEKFEGKMASASIGAMALMGKAMNNYRPCRFQREEGSLVWNTEE